MKKYLIEKLKALRQMFIIRSVVYADYKEGIMTVKYNDGTRDQFLGECTVWHKMPYMERCGTSTESMLCDLWIYNKTWKGAYPEAHKTIF